MPRSPAAARRSIDRDRLEGARMREHADAAGAVDQRDRVRGTKRGAWHVRFAARAEIDAERRVHAVDVSGAHERVGDVRPPDHARSPRSPAPACASIGAPSWRRRSTMLSARSTRSSRNERGALRSVASAESMK